ncbi:unnamed protein product [Leptidea sinapis]|uniref:Uncharacterized protein n=1 Tax=Leptidea sinapis TaxID=189913 RepID=A0A5E4PU75_9NEOP|nr:unnamed protein product [Leptidea sinapis]
MSTQCPRETMNQQLAELLAEPSGEFDNFVRMSCTDFEYLLQKISPMKSTIVFPNFTKPE